MYLRSLVFVLLSVTLATAACSSKSASNSSDQSNAGATPAATDSASAQPESSESPSAEATAAGTPAADANAGDTGVPVYPGAASQAAASYSGGGSNAPSVKAAVYTTTDSFDKVYAFYQKSLPNAMEMMHTSTPPTPGAAFVVTDPNNKGHATTVVVSTGSDGKGTISIQASQNNQ
jgi:hypothetical protein